MGVAREYLDLDTDIFLILLHHAAQFTSLSIVFDLGVGESQKVIDVSVVAQVYGPEHCASLIGFYVRGGYKKCFQMQGNERSTQTSPCKPKILEHVPLTR